MGVIERLDAEAVAGHEHPPRLLLPDHNGKHALEALQAIRAPGVIGLEHHLGVTVGAETVALGLQLLAQLAVVVDGAIEHDGQPQIGHHHGLMGLLRQIHDLQPAMAQPHPLMQLDAFAVGSPTFHGSVHGRNESPVDGLPVKPDFSADSAHAYSIYFEFKVFILGIRHFISNCSQSKQLKKR